MGIRQFVNHNISHYFSGKGLNRGLSFSSIVEGYLQLKIHSNFRGIVSVDICERLYRVSQRPVGHKSDMSRAHSCFGNYFTSYSSSFGFTASLFRIDKSNTKK